jgi:hypothetical protein
VRATHGARLPVSGAIGTLVEENSTSTGEIKEHLW